MIPTSCSARVLRTLVFAALFAAATFVAAPATASPPAAAETNSHLAQLSRSLQNLHTTGLAWGVDPRTGQLVVSYDRTVTGRSLARLTAITERYGAAVRTERLPGTLGTHIAGGDGIVSGGARCTLGFNVTDSAGTDYFLTAGHCTNVGSSWYADDQTFLGTRVGTSFPGNDYGIVRYDSSVTRTGNVNLHNGSYQDITSAGDPSIGEQLCISNPVAHRVRCGQLTALNVTITYPDGTVSGLGRIDVCSEPGDSGAPVFQGTRAVGIVSGGSGSCEAGYGVTYYQPIMEVLSAYGVTVY